MNCNQRAGVLALLSLMLVGGCATQSVQQTATLDRSGRTPRIVVMPADVQLSALTAGGIEEPKAEWTEAAQGHIRTALAAEAKGRDFILVVFDPERGAAAERDQAIEFVKVHRAVGMSILLHRHAPGFELPTKRDHFDWSLGPDVKSVAHAQDADYALFVYLRESYATAGRAATMIAAAIFGVGIPAGSRQGFASLVDLRTGNVVWFNRLVQSGGDLRTDDGATATVKALLTDLPK